VYWYRESSRELREAATRVNFVNQVSHELKTPLTNIRMYAELLGNDLEASDDPTDAKSV
jgi:signal transduction histidine kinase